jgi:O-antigen/teichoic acid export membrane protein
MSTVPAALGTDAPVSEESAFVAAARKGSVRGLLQAATGSFALNVVNLGATVLATAALARLMDLTSFGIYSWVIATITLLTVPAVLGGDRLLVRDVATYMVRGSYGHVRGLLRRTALLVVLMCVAIGVGAAAVALAMGRPADQATQHALAIGLLALPALALGRIAQGGLMGLHAVVMGQAPDLALRPILLLGLIGGTAIFASTSIGAPWAVALYGLSALGALAVAGALLSRQMGRLVGSATPEFESRRWVAAAFGLVLLSGGLVINSQIGVVLLGVLDAPQSAGIYSVAQRGAALVAFPLMALSAALAPTAARMWAAGERSGLQRIVTLGARGVLVASLPIALLFIVAGDRILALIFGPEFVVAGTALSILCLGQLANAATGSVATLLIMTGNGVRAGLGIGVGIALNVGLALILIPTYHATGAAIAAAISLLTSNLIHVVMARSSLGLDSTALGLFAKRSA